MIGWGKDLFVCFMFRTLGGFWHWQPSLTANFSFSKYHIEISRSSDACFDKNVAIVMKGKHKILVVLPLENLMSTY